MFQILCKLCLARKTYLALITDLCRMASLMVGRFTCRSLQNISNQASTQRPFSIFCYCVLYLFLSAFSRAETKRTCCVIKRVLHRIWLPHYLLFITRPYLQLAIRLMQKSSRTNFNKKRLSEKLQDMACEAYVLD